MAEGSTVAQASRKIGVTEQTFYRWRADYGGLRIDQARRLKQLETENGRLRRAVADLMLDSPLKKAVRRNFRAPSVTGTARSVCGRSWEF